MSVKSSKNSNSLGTVSRAFDLLVTLAGGNVVNVINCFQRIINDPDYRRQVWCAMTGKSIAYKITKKEWIEREYETMFHLLILEEEDRNRDSDILRNIQNMANTVKGLNSNHHFVPSHLDLEGLETVARNVGIKINGSFDRVDYGINTTTEVLECDTSAMMTPTNSVHHPFLLNYEEQEKWAKGQGGDGLTSVEETIYLIIRHFMAYNRMPFMGGTISCCNKGVREKTSLTVVFHANEGLSVSWGHHGPGYRHCGAIARKSSEF